MAGSLFGEPRKTEVAALDLTEEDEVVEMGGPTLLRDTTTEPAELDQMLKAFYDNDRCLNREGRPVSFTELMCLIYSMLMMSPCWLVTPLTSRP